MTYDIAAAMRVFLMKILHLSSHLLSFYLRFCFEDPTWASINLGILMCLDCSGIHRNLGAHITKVRSLTLDTDCWQEDMIMYFETIGNAVFNSVWESCLPSATLHPKDFRQLPALRESYIRRKYIDREFMSYFHSVIPHSEADHALCGWVEKLGGQPKKMV